MFTQVYFHKTRVAYDYHIKEALKVMLGACSSAHPKRSGKERHSRLSRMGRLAVLGELAKGNGGEHGKRLAERNHYREVHHTPEFATDDHREILRAIRNTWAT